MDLCLISQLKSYLCSTNRKGMNVIYDLSEMLTSFTMTELVKVLSLKIYSFRVAWKPVFWRKTAFCAAWSISLSEISLSVPHGRSVFTRNGCSALHGKRFFRAAWLSCRSEGRIFRRLGFRATRKAEISVGRSFMSHRKQIFPSAGLPCHSEAVLLAEDSLRAAGGVF